MWNVDSERRKSHWVLIFLGHFQGWVVEIFCTFGIFGISCTTGYNFNIFMFREVFRMLCRSGIFYYV